MKKELRQEFTYLRDNLDNRYEKSLIIKRRIMNLEVYKKSIDIALYYSMRSEVDTKELIKESLLLGKRIYLPKIINDKKMKFILINENTEYQKNSFGVMEPISGEVGSNFDLMVIPGLAFDKDNNRLGYGRGYYDNYLKNIDTYKIGICFQEQLTTSLPVEKNDIKMNLIITDEVDDEKKLFIGNNN